ncbi:uncharacterized protein LOC123430077 [Hordeum vulgare subsp. vulgare]|uniref:uncharacterized protein LOC123430077 n=1 Tax=Hordeum vulgare subsp. vulgare TaxID=112509 RepID=UPI001D1A4A01|nr:uncharacterized protein LOC123430077 [Hordeum vulgare subsp. vulgare]
MGSRKVPPAPEKLVLLPCLLVGVPLVRRVAPCRASSAVGSSAPELLCRQPPDPMVLLPVLRHLLQTAPHRGSSLGPGQIRSPRPCHRWICLPGRCLAHASRVARRSRCHGLVLLAPGGAQEERCRARPGIDRASHGTGPATSGRELCQSSSARSTELAHRSNRPPQPPPSWAAAREEIISQNDASLSGMRKSLGVNKTPGPQQRKNFELH